MKKNTLGKILLILGIIAFLCGIAYAVYRYFKPELEDEFDDDLDDAFGKNDSEDDTDEFEDTTLDD